jgi:hypothetical protein
MSYKSITGLPFVIPHDRFVVVSAVSLLPIPQVIPFDSMFGGGQGEGEALEGALLEMGMTVVVETAAIDDVVEVVVVAAAAAVASVPKDIESHMRWKENLPEFLCEQWNPHSAFFVRTMKQGSRRVEAEVAWE